MPFSMTFLLFSPELHPCSPETFYWGRLGTVWLTTGLVLATPASCVWFVLCLHRAQGRSAPRFVLGASGGFALFGLLFLAYGTSSWFCATSRDVLVQHSLLRSTRTLHWDEVRVVRAECNSTKYGRYAVVVLQWDDGTAIRFPVADRRGVNRSLYERVQAMMAHRQYDYRGDMSFSQCPPAALELFSHFRQ
jgi:hypothetical protein